MKRKLPIAELQQELQRFGSLEKIARVLRKHPEFRKINRSTISRWLSGYTGWNRYGHYRIIKAVAILSAGRNGFKRERGFLTALQRVSQQLLEARQGIELIIKIYSNQKK